MPVYKAPVDDVLFLLNDVFHIERFANLPGFAEASPDVVQAIVSEAGKFCEEVLAPLNRVGDRQGCRRDADGSVTTPDGFRQAYRQLCRRRLDRDFRAAGVRRPRPADGADPDRQRVPGRRPTWRLRCIRR